VKAITEPERNTPVLEEVDVAIVGGGPAGVAAALASSRNGVETLLIERCGHLGGMATGGIVILLGPFSDGKRQVIGGIPLEIIRRLEEEDWAIWEEALPGYVTVDPEGLKHTTNVMLEEAGARILMHSFAVDAIIEGNTVKGVILESKAGRQAVLAKVVVDASGDGDIAASAGAPYEEKMHPWGISLDHRIGGVDLEKTKEFQREHLRNVNALDPRDLTRVEIDARKRIFAAIRFYRENLPGFEKAYLVDTAPQMGVRETRRIMGEYVLTKEDIMSGRSFDDTIMCGSTETRPKVRYEVPYRCLIPRRVENLLVAGRCISCTHEALESVRVIPPCMAMGQAAGDAAALSIEKKVTPRSLNPKEVQKLLREQNAILE